LIGGFAYSGVMNVRCAHSDVSVPDFSDYRVENRTPQSITDFREKEDERRRDNKAYNYAISGIC